MKIIVEWGWGGDSVSALLRSCFRRLLMAVTRVEGTLQGKGLSLEAGRSLLRSATCRPQRRAAPGCGGDLRGLLLGTSIAPKTTDWT